MNSRERLFARLAGKPVDRIPNLNIVMLFAAKHAGIPYGKFCSDYRALVEAQTKTARDFKIDILSTMSDPFRETHDFGAPVRYQEDDLPVCDAAILSGPEDLGRLLDFDPLSGERMSDRIRAVELFRQENGSEFPILGWVEGPLAEFMDLASMSEGMMMLIDDPEFVEEALDFITQKEIACALAQLNAGADIIGMGDAAASLISPAVYRKLVFPREKKVVEAVHAHGGMLKLHICGNVTHLLPDMIETGADIVDIDFMVDYEKSVKLAEGRCSINGNLSPVELIMQGTPEKIKAETHRLMNIPSSTSLISSGCEIPKPTPEENVRAVFEALTEV